ncbi:hypothetical protein [Salinarimonas sp.]|uniref:hypothetical protein n=1 Tax=Salinarimonas sp. TaxID=2766526 RepID=UPI00391C2681
MQELVIVESGAERLKRRHGVHILQQLPPHIYVVDAAAETIEDLGKEQGTWVLSDVDPNELAILSDDERLFIEAWRRRRSTETRVFEGMNWGAFGKGP